MLDPHRLLGVGPNSAMRWPYPINISVNEAWGAVVDIRGSGKHWIFCELRQRKIGLELEEFSAGG
jgi:hypothetical protein